MNKERLLQLAEHLEHGDLGHVVFDFGHYNVDHTAFMRPANKCGYAGCAIGECPILWPDNWHFNCAGRPLLIAKGAGLCDERNSSERWFDISVGESEHLFIPYEQNTDDYGGTPLRGNATRQEVAANIRTFVEYR